MALGWDTARLADKSGLSVQTVMKAERSKFIDCSDIEKIAKVLRGDCGAWRALSFHPKEVVMDFLKGYASREFDAAEFFLGIQPHLANGAMADFKNSSTAQVETPSSQKCGAKDFGFLLSGMFARFRRAESLDLNTVGKAMVESWNGDSPTVTLCGMEKVYFHRDPSRPLDLKLGLGFIFNEDCSLARFDDHFSLVSASGKANWERQFFAALISLGYLLSPGSPKRDKSNRSPEFQAISKAEGNRLDSLLVWKS
jgi:hypothetical protein